MISEESIRNKWEEFVVIRETLDKQDPQYIKARNSLLEIYYPLVSKVAERMHKKIREVDIDDLVACGTYREDAAE
jgi:DNA-directed RNA polymerase specialized sigma subunit